MIQYSNAWTQEHIEFRHFIDILVTVSLILIFLLNELVLFCRAQSSRSKLGHEVFLVPCHALIYIPGLVLIIFL